MACSGAWAENAAGCLNFPGVPLFVADGDAYLWRGLDAYHDMIEPWAPPWDRESRGNFRGHVAGAPHHVRAKVYFAP